MQTKTINTIGIIGAGVAGIGAARLLGQAGYDCEVFEQNETLGGVWSAGYHTFGLQTPRSLYEIPDYPMPDSYPRVPSGAELQAYLENYAKDFRVYERIRFNTVITGLEQQADDRWALSVRDRKTGTSGSKVVDFVVVANGLYFDPYRPAFPGQAQFRGTVLHSSEYHTPAPVIGKKVVVVGFGKSALDVAGDAAKFARAVSLVYRKAHWPIPMDVLDVLDVRRIYLTRFAAAFLPLYQRPGQWTRRLHRYLPRVVSAFWRMTESIINFQYRLDVCGARADERFEIDIFNLDFLPRKEVYTLMRNGVIKNRRASIESFTETGIVLDNGDRIDCDVVILGTGYQSKREFLPAAFDQTLEPDGVYLYRHIIHPDLTNMAFIGRAATFSNSLTAHIATVWLINLLAGKVRLPSRAEMQAEIEAIKRWKRGFMPAIAGRSSVIKLHMVHYHDELLEDCGINPRRKRNWLAEWFGDYRPADYRAILAAIGNH